MRQKSPAGNPKGKLAGDFLLPQILQTGYRFNGNGLSRLKNGNCDVKIGGKDKNRKVRLGEQKVDQEVQRFRNRSRWTFSFFVPATDSFFACDRRNDGRNKTQKFCRMCRISRLKLCISTNKNLENVSILRKNNRLCLQNSYRLVYFMAVKREK